MKKMSHKELERKEEETGIDYDHDNEKGESPEHKEKVKKAREKRGFKEWLVENHPEILESNWIQGAINPSHKGFCTPMTKSTCTPKRKALALRFKRGDLHKGD